LHAFYKEGQSIHVAITSLNHQTGRIKLALANPPPPAWPEHALDKLKIGDETVGVVVKALTQGVFVALGEIIGFLSSSQLSKVDAPLSQSFPKGRVLRVRVLAIDLAQQKIDLSLPDTAA
jgi:ribosomal protein S1